MVQKNSKPTENQHPSCNLTIHNFTLAILSIQATFGPVWVKAEGRDLSTNAAKNVERKRSHLGWTLLGYMITCWVSRASHLLLAVHCRRAECLSIHRERCCLPGPAPGHLPLLEAPDIPLPASCLTPFFWDKAGGLGCLYRKCCYCLWTHLGITDQNCGMPKGYRQRQLKEPKFLPLSKNLPPNCMTY